MECSMALNRCEECGYEISEKAKECPNCGEPQRLNHNWGRNLIVFCFIASLVYLIFLKNYSETIATTQPPLLKLKSWNCGKEFGFIFAKGEVKNVSGRKLDNVLVIATFSTKSGEHVKTEHALLEYNPILSNQTSPFVVGGTDNPQITECNLNFKYFSGGTIPFTD